MAKDPSFQDVTGCQSALFEWADSYDTKDWARLKECIAPTLRVRQTTKHSMTTSSHPVPITQIDYRSFMDKLWEAMPSDEFIVMASDPRFLGNPLLKTQHFIGLSTWQQVSEDEVVGTHQLRVPHQRYTDSSMREVAVKGHAHGTATMWYKRVDDRWKFAGVCPHIRWTEYDYDKVFAEGKDHFGEKGEKEVVREKQENGENGEKEVVRQKQENGGDGEKEVVREKQGNGENGEIEEQREKLEKLEI